MKIPKIEQLPSGAYFCRLRIKDADGETQTIYITNEDYNVVEATAMAYKTGLIKARRQPEDLTLKQACERYVKLKARLSPSTLQGYDVIINYGFPSLMSKRLSRITNNMLFAAYEEECARKSERTGKTYSLKTVNNRYSFIVEVLKKYAPDLDTDIDRHQQQRKAVRILTPSQVFGAVKGSSVELPVLLSMWLSLSISEIRGLTKSKSIFNNQISVVETVVDIQGIPVRKEEAKEDTRVRTLDIPPYIQALIDKVDGDIIVPDSAQTITKRFYRLIEQAGLPHMNFHKLRHINASVMAELGIPDVYANERGGWSTDYVRKRVYTHTFSQERLKADKAVDDLFNSIVYGDQAHD